MAMRASLAGAIGILAGAGATHSACCHAGYPGLYVVSVPDVGGNAQARALAQAYRKPFIDGVMIRLHWDYIEPVAPGQTLGAGGSVSDPVTGEVFCPNGTTGTNYCWQELDEQLQLLDPNKKISLVVVAGGYSPSWLAQPLYGVTTIGPVLYASHGGTGPNCYTISMPLVASAPAQGAPSTFAAQYLAMMQAVAAHLQSAGVLAQVSIVKISGGVNTVTEEFHIDAAEKSGTCQTPVVKRWRTAGYTPAATVTAWAYIAGQVAVTFPAALASFDILENGFTASPPIDDAGKIFSVRRYEAHPGRYGKLLLDRALDGLVPGGGAPGLLGGAPVSVQWDGLAPADQQDLSTVATHTLAAAQNGAVLAWQANEAFNTDGSSCGTAACASAVSSSTPCYGAVSCVAEFQSLLDNGIAPVVGSALRAAFIEIWAPDVVNPCLQPALVQAHDALTGSALKAGAGCP
jgi:hypothetical protein